MTTISTQGKALITGASTGIGAIYAHKLAERGYDLILVARSAEKLADVARHIESETGRAAEVLVADLTQQTDVLRVAERIAKDDNITALVNNAGTAAVTKLLESDPAFLDQMIQLNISALTKLSLAAASSFVARKAGLIINIGSVLSLVPELLNGVYSGTKAYVLNLSISLRQELVGTGVTVQLVMPGATSTAIWDKAGVSVSSLPPEAVMSAEDMVNASLNGLDRGEFITIPSLPDMEEFYAYEKARLALRPNLSRKDPAPRYRAAQKIPSST